MINFNFIHFSKLTVSLVSALSFSVVVINPASAVSVDFTTGTTSFGDVMTAAGGASISTNALSNDDVGSAKPDSKFNYSSKAAIDSTALESNLGLAIATLDPNPSGYITATEGSGLRKTFNFSVPTTFSFDWKFLTNEPTVAPLNDYAFITINGSKTNLASVTGSSLTASGTDYARETSGSFSQTLNSGSYAIDFGVVDVVDYNNSSSLQVTNAQTQAVPEPISILASGMALGFGAILKRKYPLRKA